MSLSAKAPVSSLLCANKAIDTLVCAWSRICPSMYLERCAANRFVCTCMENKMNADMKEER